jgi:uncharacterized membrane protein YraQ (UPF0718 family)
VDKELPVFINSFISILYEAMPFIILGAVIAGLLEELVPQRIIARIIPRSRVLAIAIGGLLGLLFPMCECGIIPVMRRLLRKGVPLSCCVCYVLGGPIINVVVMLSTYVAFSGTPKTAPTLQTSSQPATSATTPKPASSNSGVPPEYLAVLAGSPQVAFPTNLPWAGLYFTEAQGQGVAMLQSAPPPPQFSGLEMMGLRMVLGFLVAFGTSLIVEWQHRKHGNKLLAPLAVADTAKAKAGDDDENGEEASRPWFQRVANISETALHDFVDITVYLILGALLAALSRLLLPPEKMQALALSYPTMAILIMMGLAILMCICSEADAFVAASFRMIPPAPKVAFLVLGPMLDFKLYMMYTRVFRPRLIWTIILAVVVQVFLYGLLVHLFWKAFVFSGTP